MTKKVKFSSSRFFCTECGNEGIPIMREYNKKREKGHLKRLFCLYCGREVNHAEISDMQGYTYTDFCQEFELGRFVDGEKIPITDLISCTKGDCRYNIDGKCWNANYSYNCQYRKEKTDND